MKRIWSALDAIGHSRPLRRLRWGRVRYAICCKVADALDAGE